MSDGYAAKMALEPQHGETEQKQTGETLARPAAPVVQHKESGKTAPRVTSVFRPNAHPNGLPEGLRTGVEQLSGLSMHDVRVHYNSSKPVKLNALSKLPLMKKSSSPSILQNAVREEDVTNAYLNQISGETVQQTVGSSTECASDLPPDAFESIEGLMGNSAASSAFAPSAARSKNSLIIQPKLTVGPVNDKYEQEADRVATQFLNRMPRQSATTTNEPTVQCAWEFEEKDLLQGNRLTNVIHRMAASAEMGGVDSSVEKQIQCSRGSGRPLENGLRHSMEGAFGADFSGVKIHSDGQADTLNRSLNARAFTTGKDVYFRGGEYSPSSTDGKKLIVHELTHVVQQNNQIVRRSIQPQIRSANQRIQRDGTLAEKTGRLKRIVARVFTKTLPTNTYRWDKREPGVIAQSGFQPWNMAGDIRLDEHVNVVLNNGDVAKYESQWVSTGAYGMLKKLDSTFAQQVLNTHLYKIDTTIAKQTGDFKDANDFFDKQGKKRPYATQREWAKLGGIPAEAVVSWMPGTDFVNQYNFVTGAPDENALMDWQAMPANE